MYGFHPQKQFRQGRLIGKQSTAVTLTCMAVCLSLCLSSGCAMTRKAWTGLSQATGGEPTAGCGCACGEGLADKPAAHAAGHHAVTSDPARVDSQAYAATPSPPEGSRPIEQGIRPQAATMNGIPGTFTPSPPATKQFEFQDQNTANLNSPTTSSPESQYVDANAQSMRQSPGTAEQTPLSQMRPEPTHHPDVVEEHHDLKDCRTQLQILAEQLSQMKTTQESMKASQDTLQQSHTLQILELKLQQTTTDRDRLQREHDLEQQLYKQRQRELETIDSLSDFIEDVAPDAAVPNTAPRQVPRPTTQSGQVRSQQPQNLPTVDESL